MVKEVWDFSPFLRNSLNFSGVLTLYHDGETWIIFGFFFGELLRDLLNSREFWHCITAVKHTPSGSKMWNKLLTQSIPVAVVSRSLQPQPLLLPPPLPPSEALTPPRPPRPPTRPPEEERDHPRRPPPRGSAPRTRPTTHRCCPPPRPRPASSASDARSGTRSDLWSLIPWPFDLWSLENI